MARREKLIYNRTSRGWSQRDVRDALLEKFNVDITTSYYGMIEQGVRTPKLDLALAIAKLFEYPPEDLFFEPIPNVSLGSANTA